MLLAHLRFVIGFSLISLIFNKLLTVLAVSFLWSNSRIICPIIWQERSFRVELTQTRNQFPIILRLFCHRTRLLRSTCWQAWRENLGATKILLLWIWGVQMLLGRNRSLIWIILWLLLVAHCSMQERSLGFIIGLPHLIGSFLYLRHLRR